MIKRLLRLHDKVLGYNLMITVCAFLSLEVGLVFLGLIFIVGFGLSWTTTIFNGLLITVMGLGLLSITRGVCLWLSRLGIKTFLVDLWESTKEEEEV